MTRSSRIAAACGQGTVEAAVVVPVLFLGLLLLLQPGMLLYDRVVMQGAAVEACRLLATKTDVLGDMNESCESFVRHRLGAVPPVDCFHVHEDGCTWSIELDGDENSSDVSVSITTEAKPLPLIGSAASLLGALNDRGNLEVRVSASMPTQPSWAGNSPYGQMPSAWAGAWLA